MEHNHALQVTVTRQDDSHALAEARGHQIVLNIKKAAARPALPRRRRSWLPWEPVC